MAGPVWGFDATREAVCDSCLRACTGVYVEGEIADNELSPVRAVCPDCMARTNEFVVSGEAGGRAAAPAYAHSD
jgi:hypothetical protein